MKRTVLSLIAGALLFSAPAFAEEGGIVVDDAAGTVKVGNIEVSDGNVKIGDAINVMGGNVQVGDDVKVDGGNVKVGDAVAVQGGDVQVGDAVKVQGGNVQVKE